MSEAVRWVKTKAGLQGVLIDSQRTLDHIGAIRSNIPLSEQIKGTMFEPPKPLEPDLFDAEKKP
jgi:hypothetical protein